MNRRGALIVLGAVVLAGPLPTISLAQPRPIPRIGLLIPETMNTDAARIDALRSGLRERGYIEGRNIVIEARAADGNYDRLPGMAAELVALKVDAIVVFGSKAVSAAQGATTTIPIVDPVMGDPIAAGLGTSLARPGKNVTGSVQFSVEAGAKRLEFLKEAAPRIARAAVMINPANPGSARQVQAIRATANALNVDLRVFEIHGEAELAAMFATIERDRVDAILVPTDSLFRANAAEISDRAAKLKLPSAGSREYANAGGLIGYGPDAVDLYRHAAYFVDRIIKGAKPAELPIEQATKVDLVINLRTAKTLGIAIPQTLLVRANDVVR